ncbi:MAG: transcriptional regulator PpsR [Rhodobacteraceae bacterium]|nr:transcriptional regulator PpsR [Paracoccaceae bacterium]
MTKNGHSHMGAGSFPLVSPDLFRELVSAAADITIIVSASWMIVSVLANPANATFGQVKAWEGRPVSEILRPESYEKFKGCARQLAFGAGPSRAIELNHAERGAEGPGDFPVRYTLHVLNPDGALIMLGRDLRPIAEAQQQLVNAQLELERDYELQREGQTRYRAVMQATSDAFVLVSMPNGRVVDANDAAAGGLGMEKDALIGGFLVHELDGRRLAELQTFFADPVSVSTATPFELIARRSRHRVVVVPSVFRAAGDRFALCRIDLPDEVANPGSETMDAISSLFRLGPESVVFTDRNGVVRAANDSFLALCDQAGAQAVVGQSLGEFLARGAVDLKVLTENARRNGAVRVYATRVRSTAGSEVPVEVSATWLGDLPEPVLGFVIRETGRADVLRRKGPGTVQSAQSVAELVGASSLREIVAQTTDVIEKICIETALELTRNNRLAAAEMLGLSRQSLYVKLRKFGMAEKDEA